MFNIDNSFLKDNRINVEDLMFAVTFTCNRRCKHCYISSDWLNTKSEFCLNEAKALINSFGREGLSRVTILGGEPFLYSKINNLIVFLQNYNIAEKRIATNGQELKYFNFDEIQPDHLDHISFSFEGHNSELHDDIRGAGSFGNAISNMNTFMEKGFNVRVTFTVTAKNLPYVKDAVYFFKSRGISELNFHLISMIGNAEKHPELHVRPDEWVSLYSDMHGLRNLSGMTLRIPPMYVTEDEYEELKLAGYRNLMAGSYSTGRQGHRILIYPNGRVYVSCDLTGTDYHIAEYSNGKFYPNINSKNELSVWKMNMDHPSLSAKLRKLNNNGYIPLSVSYKKTLSY